ncbi:MAG: hypothetical protein ACREGL_12350 [Alphaproteobacteria bacterium]
MPVVTAALGVAASLGLAGAAEAYTDSAASFEVGGGALQLALAAQKCSPPKTGASGAKPYEVRVKIDVPQTPINHKMSAKQLTARSFHGRGGQVLGQMVPELEIAHEAQYAVASQGNQHCFWVERIDVVLRYKSIEIFIASEYQSGSCAYTEIMDHEQDHVRVARQNLQQYGPRVRQALTSLLIPTVRAPVLVRSADDAKREVEALFAKLLKPLFGEMIATLKRNQGALDTPEEYRAVRARCSDW